MATLSVIKLSNSTFNSKDVSLRQPTRKIENEELQHEWFKNVLLDMFETLYSSPSGVGLAAPQIGLQIKLIVVDIKRNAKKPMILINPIYYPLSEESCISTESCMSIPNFNGHVPRYKEIMVEYIDINGNFIEHKATGFESIVLQHEIDHLNGILYIDRLSDTNDINEYLGVPNKTATEIINRLYGGVHHE